MKAQWIWTGGEAAPVNQFTWFRKVITLDKLPKNGMLRFAADSNAQLWLNGVPLRRKVTRFTPPSIRAEVVNALPYLREGENVIAVLHHNWGGITTFMRTGNTQGGLYLRTKWLHTDDTWRWKVADEFAPHADQCVGIEGDAPRIRFPVILDGAKTPEGIHAPGFDDSGWACAVPVKEGPWPSRPQDVETDGQREHYVLPPAVLAAGRIESPAPPSEAPYSIAEGLLAAKLLPDEGMASAARAIAAGGGWTISGKAGEACYVTFDFHRPLHGFPALALHDAAGGAVIDMGYGEIYRSLYSGEAHIREDGWVNTQGVVGKGYADRYITRAGDQCVELPDERTARWWTLHFRFQRDTTIRLASAGFVKSQYPLRMVGSFDCGDERIAQIVKLCHIHAEVTMSDACVDTPGREDGQWIEDIRPRALITERWYGDHQLRRLLIRTHAEGQLENGNLHPFAPSNYPMPAPYDWSVQWVASLYDDYMWTGDKDHLRTYWPTLCRYWDHILGMVDDEGLFRTNHLLVDIRVGVRCVAPHHSSGIITPWFIERLRWSAELARALDKEKDEKRWRTTANRMEDAFRKYHVVPAEDDVPAHVADRLAQDVPDEPRGYSQAGQTIAITSGLLKSKDARADVDYAFPDPEGSPPEGVTRWNNPTYAYRALKTLSCVGRSDRAVRHLIERYAPYLPGDPRNPTPPRFQGPYGGPLPEYWISREDLELKPGEPNTAQPSDDTGSHGWGAVPLLWMHECLLGVRIARPGGERIDIRPDAAGLPYVAGHTMTPKGLVWVHWDPKVRRLEVTVPDKVRATVYAPVILGADCDRFQCIQGKSESISMGCYIINGPGGFTFEQS